MIPCLLQPARIYRAGGKRKEKIALNSQSIIRFVTTASHVDTRLLTSHSTNTGRLCSGIILSIIVES
jgi:hypothetical protein